MTDKFRNKYRIASARAQWWDYRKDAAYFVTICTKDRQCFFGDVVKGKMLLSHTGVIADILWNEIKNHAKNVDLCEYVIMPNHVHGILVLSGYDQVNDDDGNGRMDDAAGGGMDDAAGGGMDDAAGVETLHATSLPGQPRQKKWQHDLPLNDHMASISPKSSSLSTIIRSYKSAVSRHSRRLGFDFAWQSRFHDHIIRNEQAYQRIAEYIVNNPAKWEEDKFYS